MAIRTICPNCQTVYSLADELAGKTVRCKKCAGAIAVRAAKGDAEADVYDIEANARQSIQARPQAGSRAARTRRREQEDEWDSEPSIQKSNRGMVIALIAAGAGMVLLLGGGAIGLVFLLTSRTPAPPPRFPVDEEIGIGPGFKPPPFRIDDEEPLPNGDAVTRALHQLKSPKAHQRREAARKLKDMLPGERRAEVAKALTPLLSDSDFFTRKFAIEALGVWGDKDAVPLLLKAMQEKETRGDAMKALARIKDERATEPIAARLEVFEDALEAAEALKLMGSVAEKAVLARLNHGEIHVRIMVCEVLKVIGTKKSIPPLEKAVEAGKDPFSGQDHLVAMQAKETIKAIKRRQ